jgi:DNA-binding Lrp family transcriptional regulator
MSRAKVGASVGAIIEAMQGGLPLTSRPFAHIAERVGADEQTVIETVQELRAAGTIKRFGVVVRHHELGYRANGMLVIDVPDDAVESIAGRLAEDRSVTLCYRRPRRLPAWPYNLFCMIHGRDRGGVQRKVDALLLENDLQDRRSCVLFSRRRFKQRGAMYVSTDTATEASVDG